jgi:hypothetical protein
MNQHQYLECIIKACQWFQKAKVLDGDLGEHGVYEGFNSNFSLDGTKELKINYYIPSIYAKRADCTADTGTAFAFASKAFSTHYSSIPKDEMNALISKDLIQHTNTIGSNLMHELFSEWQHMKKNILRGFFGWYNDPYDMQVFYADDNGRCTMEALLYAMLTQNEHHIQQALAAVIALKKTHGKNGHRFARLEFKHLLKRKGRNWFQKHKIKKHQYHSPHYEAWTFAALILGGYLGSDQDLIALTASGIDDYMQNFPKLPLEHSVNDDFSKLLVAVAILCNISPIPRYQHYMNQLVEYFASIQDAITGAIPERDPFKIRDRAETTNEKYGKGEASVYTSPEDTITDQLYSTAFTAIGLYFASLTNTSPQSEKMLVKLLNYLCCIQIKSANLQLNGTWMRAFDYSLGEYYGANGDVGWGAYSIETGWMVAPTILAFSLYLTQFNPFQGSNSPIIEIFNRIYQEETHVQDNIQKSWQQNLPSRQYPTK